MGRRLVMGDIHGRLDYLQDVLKKCNFDYENDTLIQVGDLVDRGSSPFECMDELLKVKNLILIVGNHDSAFLEWVSTGSSVLGTHNSNGTEVTYLEWKKLSNEQHIHYLTEFFAKQRFFHITEDNICFVHGGFDREHPILKQTGIGLCWDRELVKESMSCTGTQKLKTADNFKEIFIGHTPTIYWNKVTPISRGGVTNVDTGAGKGGPLTVMDIDTKEFWQSDLIEHDRTKLIKYGIIKEG